MSEKKTDYRKKLNDSKDNLKSQSPSPGGSSDNSPPKIDFENFHTPTSEAKLSPPSPAGSSNNSPIKSSEMHRHSGDPQNWKTPTFFGDDYKAPAQQGKNPERESEEVKADDLPRRRSNRV